MVHRAPPSLRERFFTRSGVIGVLRNRRPASLATALAIAGDTSVAAIWLTPGGWFSVGTTEARGDLIKSSLMHEETSTRVLKRSAAF